jgi:hypothetical protein
MLQKYRFRTRLTCIIHEFTPRVILTGNICPHYPTFLFASPKRKVAKEKGDFLPIAPLPKK